MAHAVYNITVKEKAEHKLTGTEETSFQNQANEGASSELFMGNQKLKELERLTRVACDHIEKQKKVMESILSSLVSVKQDLMKGSFEKLNQLIDVWNSNLDKDRISIGRNHCQQN